MHPTVIFPAPGRALTVFEGRMMLKRRYLILTDPHRLKAARSRAAFPKGDCVRRLNSQMALRAKQMNTRPLLRFAI
jgi:hypothetical protein